MTLIIDGLRKRFGEIQALDGVSFSVARGQVFGFLGANGSGKTTTMRIVLGLMRPDEGAVSWEGQPARSWPRRTWGYMPEERGLYLRMPVMEQLVHIAALYGVGRRHARTEAQTWLERFRIPDVGARRLDSLSKGNQQKVQYIATILHDPDVLLMDEPFVGLDPVNVAMLKSAFLDMRDRGKTLVFSTHQLETAEALCDSVAIIHRGRIVTSGTTREVRRSTGHRAVRLATAADDGLGWLTELPEVQVTREGHDYAELRVGRGTDAQDILRAAVARGEEVLRFEVTDPSLEDVFVERVGAAIADDERTLAAAGSRS
ncbi:MAG TPA: ATP-binding cassette domain-containing protein [Candidatus Limnocylindrales bacterium]|nr:ATP-binding cassette domain-containing protein [Candidatus Limnocylindrales bacterium]